MDEIELSAGALRELLAPLADPDAAVPMAAYMKGHFEFLGITSDPRRKAAKPILQASAGASADELMAFAVACWHEPEREFQHTACEVLRKRSAVLEPDQLEDIADELLVKKSWWDTIDPLAAWVVGPLVARHPDLAHTMDDWAEGDHMWLARVAILHQLNYKSDTDAERLFGYAADLASHQDFFIRKAIGWALRQYGRTDPDAVRGFVAAHEHELSGLSRREALKHL